MKASELRIGNLVRRVKTGEIMYILAVDISTIHQGLLTVEGIPLTEEWLLRFGLKPNSDKSIFMLTERPQWDDVTIRDYGKNQTPSQVNYSVWYGDAPIMDQPLQYVHQIQNLYFALTGKELTINHEHPSSF